MWPDPVLFPGSKTLSLWVHRNTYFCRVIPKSRRYKRQTTDSKLFHGKRSNVSQNRLVRPFYDGKKMSSTAHEWLCLQLNSPKLTRSCSKLPQGFRPMIPIQFNQLHFSSMIPNSENWFSRQKHFCRKSNEMPDFLYSAERHLCIFVNPCLIHVAHIICTVFRHKCTRFFTTSVFLDSIWERI